MKTDYSVNSWLIVGLNFAWMPQIFPTVKIVPLKGAYFSLSDTFSNVSIEGPFTFVLTDNKRCALSIVPSYEHWKDGHSNAEAAKGTKLGLPGNTYHFAGVDF